MTSLIEKYRTFSPLVSLFLSQLVNNILINWLLWLDLWTRLALDIAVDLVKINDLQLSILVKGATI